MLNLQVADRMKEYEEGIFQLLDEKKAEVEKTGKRYITFLLVHRIFHRQNAL